MVAIKAPGFGERRKALLQDIAIVTGAEYISKDLGMKIGETQMEQLGIARKVREGVCNHDMTCMYVLSLLTAHDIWTFRLDCDTPP